MTENGFSGNAFEHWQHAVLTGATTHSFLFLLRNSHFKRPSEPEFRGALEAWAARHGVTLRYGHALAENGEGAACVHFTHPRQPAE